MQAYFEQKAFISLVGLKTENLPIKEIPYPNHPSGWYYYGQCLFHTGEYQAAAR
ncbi:hypothetical protein [Nostoc sp.]|uniref:hypothetical protein n=1 Tax=Nostoc sp. TaxID=1180 RepID=UPI002FFB9FFB